MSSKETVLECGFAKDMCTWSPGPSQSWYRVKDTIASSLENFGWNLPPDFYHAFAMSNGSNHPGIELEVNIIVYVFSEFILN